MTGRNMEFTVRTFTMPGGTVGYRVTAGRPGAEFDALADALAQLSHDIAGLAAVLADVEPRGGAR